MVLPDDAFVTVINAEAGSDGIAEVFARPIKVVIIENTAAQSDEADNQAARAAALSAMIRRRLPSVRLRDGGRNGTNTSTAGKLGADFGLGAFIEVGQFEHEVVW